MFSRLWRYALLVMLVAVPAFASGNAGYWANNDIRVNVSSLQSALGLGTVDPTRAIQQAMTITRTEASAPWLPRVVGTTTWTGCGSADNIIVGSTACNPSGCSGNVNVTFCSGGKWVLTLHNPPSQSWTWKNYNDGSAVWEVSQAVMRGVLRLHGAISSDPMCLTGAWNQGWGSTNRNVVCEDEIEQMAALQGGHMTSSVISIRSKVAAWPLPGTGSTQWNNPIPLMPASSDIFGFGFGDYERGVTEFSGWPGVYYDSDVFFYGKITDPTNHPVVRKEALTSGALGTELTLPAGLKTLRKVTTAYDYTRHTYYLFAHVKGSNTQNVTYYTSTDGNNWTLRGLVRGDLPHPASWSPHNPHNPEPIQTLRPVTAAYDPLKDIIVLAYVSPYGTYWSTYVTSIPASVGTNEMRWEGDQTIFADVMFPESFKITNVPTVACSATQCSWVFTDGSDARKLWLTGANIHIGNCPRTSGNWSSPHCAWGGPGSTFTTAVPLGGAQSDYPVGLSCRNDTCEIVAIATDHETIYTNRRTGYTTYSGWNTIGVQTWTQGPNWKFFPLTGPVIRLRESAQDYRILIGGNIQCQSNCNVPP